MSEAPPDDAPTAVLDPEPQDRPRQIPHTRDGADDVFRGVLRSGGIAVLVITGLIGFFLVFKASSALRRAGLHFFTRSVWLPDSNNFGIASVLPNGVIIALIALVIAVPIGLLTALFISEYAPARLSRALTALVDLMAAIPSIIYALWGVFFLQPEVISTVRWVADHLGFVPFLKVPSGDTPSGFTASTFMAGLVVSLMVIPIVISISREVFTQAPQGEREAAYALGSTRWGMIRTVVLPYGRGGVIGAIMLGFGRAMGETIAVSLIISPIFTVVTHVLQTGGMSIPALIALRYGESTPEMIASLMAAGLVLFAVTLLVNALAGVIVTRSRSGRQTS
jgi:phosphate transport system permease protein